MELSMHEKCVFHPNTHTHTIFDFEWITIATLYTHFNDRLQFVVTQIIIIVPLSSTEGDSVWLGNYVRLTFNILMVFVSNVLKWIDRFFVLLLHVFTLIHAESNQIECLKTFAWMWKLHISEYCPLLSKFNGFSSCAYYCFHSVNVQVPSVMLYRRHNSEIHPFRSWNNLNNKDQNHGAKDWFYG